MTWEDPPSASELVEQPPDRVTLLHCECGRMRVLDRSSLALCGRDLGMPMSPACPTTPLAYELLPEGETA